jgi:hypothetical protein
LLHKLDCVRVNSVSVPHYEEHSKVNE